MPARHSTRSSKSMSTFDIFVSGLPERCNRSMLQELASNFGNFAGAKVLFNSKSHYKNGFVSFYCIESARYFICALNGQDPLNCGIKFVARFADGKNGERKKLHVGNLSPTATEFDLFNIGKAYGSVLSTKILAGKGCGFISFSTQEEAEACIAGSESTSFTVVFAKNGKNKRLSRSSTSTTDSRASTATRSSAMSPRPTSPTSPTSDASAMSPGNMQQQPMWERMMPVQNFSPSHFQNISPINQTIDQYGNIITIFPYMSEMLSGMVPYPAMMH